MSVSFQIEYYLDYSIVILIFQASNSLLQLDRKLKTRGLTGQRVCNDRSNGLKKNSEVRFPHGNFYFFHARDKTKNISLQ